MYVFHNLCVHVYTDGGGPKLIAVRKKPYKWYNFQVIKDGDYVDGCVFFRCPNFVSNAFSNMITDQIIWYTIGEWRYSAIKLNDACIKQTNSSTKKIRYFDRVGEQTGSRFESKDDTNHQDKKDDRIGTDDIDVAD